MPSTAIRRAIACQIPPSDAALIDRETARLRITKDELLRRWIEPQLARLRRDAKERANAE